MFSQLLKSKATMAGKYVYILIQEGDTHLNRKTLTWAEKYSPGQEVIHPERKILTWTGRYVGRHILTRTGRHSLGENILIWAEVIHLERKMLTWAGRYVARHILIRTEVPTWAGMILTWAGRCRTR